MNTPLAAFGFLAMLGGGLLRYRVEQQAAAALGDAAAADRDAAVREHVRATPRLAWRDRLAKLLVAVGLVAVVAAFRG